MKTNELIARLIKRDAVKMVAQWPPCMTIITHQPERPIMQRGQSLDLSSSIAPEQHTKTR